MEESVSGSAEEIHIEARAAELDSNSIIIKSSAGSERVKMGIRDTSETGAAIAALGATASSVAMISSTTITTGLWIGSTLVVGEDELVLQSDQSTGDGEGAHLIGITKDAADTMEADNFSISGDGNFYTRAITGDVDCTAGVGGVEDGWFGIQTTTEEAQFCSGALTRIMPSVAIGDTPSTVTCTSGNVLINAVIKNGIIIGGTCAAN